MDWSAAKHERLGELARVLSSKTGLGLIKAGQSRQRIPNSLPRKRQQKEVGHSKGTNRPVRESAGALAVMVL